MGVKAKVKKPKQFIKALLVMGLFVYAIYAFAHQSIMLNNNNAQLSELNAQMEAALHRRQELETQLERVGTPEYMEEIARRRDGLVMPNEIIFIDVLAN